MFKKAYNIIIKDNRAQGERRMKARVKQKGTASGRVARRENFHLNLMVLPGILLFLVFNYLPMAGIVIAFKDYNPNLGILDSPWCGLKNFTFFFTSQDAARVIGNTVLYSITFLIVDLIAGVGLALMFYNLRSRKALKFYNTVVILPRFMSAVIVAFIVFIILNPSYGIANQVIKALGGSGIQWYMKPGYWPVILTLVNAWKGVGYGAVIYLASILGIDRSLYEAAAVDGIGKMQEIRYITLPLIKPTVITMLLLSIGRVFYSDFGLFYQVPMNSGMLYDVTTTSMYMSTKD